MNLRYLRELLQILLQGKTLLSSENLLKTLTERVPLRATIDKDVIIGSIIFIDSYGNAISNITREVFYRVFENKAYRILIQSNKNYTDHISEKYSDVPVGEMLARFNQLDLLEISINGADVAELLSLDCWISSCGLTIAKKKHHQTGYFFKTFKNDRKR